jgi:BirA family biotin operon repressor/biotin-[acetyl-CoA-carboxylase] ligase
MTKAAENMVRLLADGATHSGTQLAAELGITRAAVWKRIQQLADLGLDVAGQAGSGYSLAEPLELLVVGRIRAGLPPSTLALLDSLEVAWSLPSTNDYLLQQQLAVAERADVCFAEFQSGGRGRRGRRWFAPVGHGLCLSVAWRFSEAPEQLHCLGLAIGTAVLRALQACGIGSAQLKWPNDVMLDDGKLAGILIDVQGEADGPLRVVAGVGLNFRLTAATTTEIGAAGGLRPAAIADVDATVSRNLLATHLVAELIGVLANYASTGFAPSIAAWRAADYLQGRTVSVAGARGTQSGVASGIAADGQLQLATANGVVQLLTGDVSVRPQT